MEFKSIEHAKEIMVRNLTEAREIADLAVKSQDGVFTAEQSEKIVKLVADAEGAKKHIKDTQEAAAKAEGMKSRLDALGEFLGSDEKKTDSGLVVPQNAKSLGDAFVKSGEYQNMVKSLPSSPNERRRMHIQSGRFEGKDLTTGLGGRGILSPDLDLTAGAFVQPDRLGLVDRLVRQPLTMRDVVTKSSTTSDTIEYVRELSNENNAEFVPEAVTAGTASVPADGSYHLATNTGGYKPQGSFALETAETTVKTIAEWMPVTTRALSDAGQIRGLIDSKLRDDIAEVEDTQLLSGNGTGENLRGLLQTSGLLTYGAAAGEIATVLTDPGLSHIEMVKRAKTKVRITGRANANAVMMNPADAEEVYLARIAKNPAADGVSGADFGIAGLAVIENEKVAEGTAVVGDFRRAVIWDREGISLSATNSHADFFIRNLVAILAEKRLAFGVLRPSAFCVVTLAGTPAP